MAKLEEKNMKEEFMVLLGGVIPAKDFDELKKMGVANVFGPGSMTSQIVNFIKDNIEK
ncbi:MAG: Methylmalonyl-CoA mutase [Promethearchaeota archaeon]|nr:MAG: Methylmalonyl-CoA mutase [Candidatus Lokiarchaeota archaeon]